MHGHWPCFGKRMHIAYVTETFPPELNGVAMSVARVIAGLRARGHAIDLVRPRQPGESACNVPTEWRTPGLPIPVYRDLRIGLPLVRRLKQRWRQSQPDVVHVATEGPLGWAAIRAARAIGVPVSSDFRTDFESYSAHYGFGWCRAVVAGYMRVFHNATDRTFVPTPQMRARLSAQGYQRLSVIGRGVDSSRYSPAHRNAELRASWGAGPADPVVLYVGRLASEKNVPLVFKAFTSMKQRAPRARLVVVGEGPMRSRLERAYPEAIFTGQRSGAVLAEHYSSADIFLFPSLTDTFGNVTLEALASGLAVVAFRTAAAEVHITDCTSGVLAEPGDEQDFIAGACAAVQQFPRLAPMRAAARSAAMGASWEAIVGRFEACLKDTVHAVEAHLAGSCTA